MPLMTEESVVLDLSAVHRPGSAAEALRSLAEGRGRGLYVAGGTIVVPAGSPNLDYLVDLTDAGLSGLRVREDGSIDVGATTRVSDLARAGAIASFAGGLLREAALAVANHTVRNLATVGGNLASWHFPTDLPPALLALDAEALLLGTGGERRVPLEDLYARRADVFRKGDLIVEVALPSSSRRLSGAFEKSGRANLDVAAVNCAVALAAGGGTLTDVRIALNGVGATPLRARDLESRVAGMRPGDGAIDDAIGEFCETLTPQSDHRASSDYRRKLARVLIGRALGRAGGLNDARDRR